MATQLRVVSTEEVRQLCRKQDPVDPDTLIKTKVIVDDVRQRGDAALLEYATKFGDIQPGQSHIVARAELKKAFEGLPQDQQGLLQRTANRIRNFAEAQMAALKGSYRPPIFALRLHTLILNCYFALFLFTLALPEAA